MNKNNKSIINSFQQPQEKYKSKDLSGKSEFTKSKLEREYDPKIKLFKHKVLVTTDQQKHMLKRLELQKQQQIVSRNALQCFKKGQWIDLDWKTRNNFRKSDLYVKFPRIKTEPLQAEQQNQQNNKSNRQNIFESLYSKLLKDKSIDDKCSKLKELLDPTKTNRNKSHKKTSIYSQNHQNNEECKGILTSKRSPKFMNQTSKKYEKSMRVTSKKYEQSQNLTKFLKQQNINRSKNVAFNFVVLRSQTQDMQNVKFPLQIDQISQINKQPEIRFKSIPSKNDSLSIAQNSVKKSKTKSISFTDQQMTKSIIISLQQKKDSVKNNKNNDILNDPDIYMLISRSRDKIINWKQNFVLGSMDNIQRIKFLQQKGNSQSNIQGAQKIRSISLQGSIKKKKLSKEKILQKIQSKKRVISQKISKKLSSRVFTETQSFIKNISLNNSGDHCQVYQYLGIKTPKICEQKFDKIYKSRSNKIKQRKKQSLVEVQQKLLKRVKLQFLKQDLTKKFEQIRNQQQYNHSIRYN